MKTLTDRICVTCSKELTTKKSNIRIGNHVEYIQCGFYCCDDYICSINCLKIARNMSYGTWEAEHYQDDGDCYWTEWELNFKGETL